MCSSQSQQILYGWGKNAPPMQLPPGVGFQVGQGTSTHTLVLQVGLHWLPWVSASPPLGLPTSRCLLGQH